MEVVDLHVNVQSSNYKPVLNFSCKVPNMHGRVLKPSKKKTQYSLSLIKKKILLITSSFEVNVIE